MLPSFLSGCFRKSGVAKFHFLSSVDATAWTSSMNNIGPRLSPCLTPTVPLISISSSPTFIMYVTLEWSFFRMMMRLFGIPYNFSIFHKSSWLTESNVLTRSINKT